MIKSKFQAKTLIIRFPKSNNVLKTRPAAARHLECIIRKYYEIKK